jgi:hypothetical protein
MWKPPTCTRPPTAPGKTEEELTLEAKALVSVIEFEKHYNDTLTGLGDAIVNECIKVVALKWRIKREYPFVARVKMLVELFNVYLTRCKDHPITSKILTPRSGMNLAGLPDTLNIMIDYMDSSDACGEPATIVNILVGENKLPAQSGGKKIRKYRKMRSSVKTRHFNRYNHHPHRRRSRSYRRRHNSSN